MKPQVLTAATLTILAGLGAAHAASATVFAHVASTPGYAAPAYAAPAYGYGIAPATVYGIAPALMIAPPLWIGPGLRFGGYWGPNHVGAHRWH